MSNTNPLGDNPTSRTGAGLTSSGVGAGTTGGTSGSESEYSGSRSHEGLDTTRSGVPGRIRGKAAKVKEQVSEYTGNNPILSLALAFFAGVLLTAITRR